MGRVTTLCSLLLIGSLSRSQPSSSATSILLQAGASTYVSTQFGVGGSPDASHWKIGPNVGIGAQFARLAAFDAILQFDFAEHSFSSQSGSSSIGSPKARVYDLSISAKTKGEGFVSGGMGLNYTVRDEVRLSSGDTFLESFNAEHGFSLMFKLALGGEFKLGDKLDLMVQLEWRIRQYSTFALNAGVRFPI
jgi:hypothetical protein